MSLIACFFSLACLFLLQRAELIGVLEVLVYAGAIMVLFVFVIMLVENKQDAIAGQHAMGVIVKIGAVAFVAGAIQGWRWGLDTGRREMAAQANRLLRLREATDADTRGSARPS
jgi:NADH:ubiquinone oxidoreductase subunit 6 (subunit J)